MHWFATLLCSLTLCMGSMYATEQSTEKLIVSSSQDEAVAQENLLKLKVYLLENPSTRLLQDKYPMHIKLEHFEQYNAVVITPVDSIELRNRLLILLHPVFPDIFYINEQKMLVQKKGLLRTMEPKRPPRDGLKIKEKSWIDEIGLQWLAIWILAVIGLVLSLRNRRKMAQLDKTQTEIKVDQSKIEKEIKALGDEDV